MDQIRQCMDNKEPSRVKFRRAEPDPPLLAVRLGSARLEYQFASVWRITDRTRAPTIEKSVHSVFTTVGQTLRTTRSAKAGPARELGSTRLEMDQIRQCMDNKEPSRVKFRRAEPDPPLLAVRLGSSISSPVYGALRIGLVPPPPKNLFIPFSLLQAKRYAPLVSQRLRCFVCFE
ncbi:hypothetical protein J6590_092035 [Homalodisca vitripennis]|nr:hypothetical protein J6590_092035 [Homalodisca vitripennis]